MALALLLLPLLACWVGAQEADKTNGTIIHTVDASKLVPVSLSGFTDEALQVLRFDLPIQGFAITAPDQAEYQISGSNAGHLEGRITPRRGTTPILAMAYPASAPMRRQAHAFTDDIVKKLRPGQIPIAQTKIAFKVESGRNSDIWMADFDGHNARQLTAENSLVVAPCWVPGKWKIYYTSYRQSDHPDIYSYELEAGTRRTIARYAGSNLSPAPSPDGSHVAMILSKNGGNDLYVSDANGGNLKQLTFKADASSPCWSPDGKTICFVSRLPGRPGLYTIPPTGGRMQRLRTPGAIGTTEPDWSPDGKFIAFTAQMGGFQICVLDVAGGNVLFGLAAGEDPSWSANSRTLIYCHRMRDRGDYSLSLLDVPTKQVKNIARISGSCSEPSWAR